MPKSSAILAGAFVVAMAIPPGVNLLAPIGGDLPVSISPLLLTAGLLFGIRAFFGQHARAKQLLSATNRYLLAFLLLATLSVIWSGFPLTTAYRLYRLYAMFAICFYFSMDSWKAAKFTEAVKPALLFLTLGSIVYYFISPEGAVQESVINGMVQPELVGAWRGITLHKNTLGSLASVAVIVFFHSLYTGSGKKIWNIVGLICALICLINARSSTSIFAALFSVSLILLVLKSFTIKKRRNIKILATTLVVFFLIYSLGVLNIVPGLSAIIEPMVAMTGKDMTFSGRTRIWAIMKDEIVQHPILGAGYAAFWMAPDPMSPSNIFKIRMYIDPGEAHNGYVDVINELGIVGIVALFGYIFAFLRQAIQLLEFDRKKATLFIGLLFAELIANMSEAHWWNLANVNFYIMTLATFDLGRALLEAQRAKAIQNSRARMSAQAAEQARSRLSISGETNN